MKKINTSFIATNEGMPIKKGTLDHIENAQAEAVSAFGKACNVDGVNPFILFGCVQSNTGPAYSYTAGVIMTPTAFGFEPRFLPATSFTLGGGQVPVVNLVTNYPYISATQDPHIFRPNNDTHNVLQEDVVTITSAASGSGYVDFSTLKRWTDDKWHIVNASGEPAYQNSWSNGGVGIVFKKENNRVTITGDVANAGAINSIVFQLPTGYRPVNVMYFASAIAGGVDTMCSGSVDISGNVTVGSNSGTTNKRIVFSISFPTN